jgi:hypothetical protein
MESLLNKSRKLMMTCGFSTFKIVTDLFVLEIVGSLGR